MIELNKYIIEAWDGVKKHTNNTEIEAWCDEMGIKDYTINDKGEIDANGNVSLTSKNFKELPYKFGIVKGYFDIKLNKNLISLKNCPNTIKSWFACSDCTKLDSLEGCPKEVNGSFYCFGCKRNFTEEEIQKYCNVKKHNIIL